VAHLARRRRAFRLTRAPGFDPETIEERTVNLRAKAADNLCRPPQASLEPAPASSPHPLLPPIPLSVLPENEARRDLRRPLPFSASSIALGRDRAAARQVDALRIQAPGPFAAGCGEKAPREDPREKD
jgi:hypothetical protein